MILHLTSRDAWLAAQESGKYSTPSLQADGFIHCSTEKQIVRVADTFYTGQHGLVLLVVDPSRLKPELRWEPPAHPNPQADDLPPSDELFPHIYGLLNVDAVTKVVDFEPDHNGKFSMPTV